MSGQSSSNSASYSEANDSKSSGRAFPLVQRAGSSGGDEPRGDAVPASAGSNSIENYEAPEVVRRKWEKRAKNRPKIALKKCGAYHFVLNNYSKQELKGLMTMGATIEDSELLRYLCIGAEMGKRNTPHIHGYLEFKAKSHRSIVAIKNKWPLLRGANFSEARGSAEENKKYCWKGLFHCHEWGTPGKAKQGQRSDLDAVAERIKGGATELEIFKEFGPQYIKYPNGINRALFLANEELAQQYRKCEVRIYWGDTRAGKTKAVFDEFGANSVFRLTRTDIKLTWWDGYHNQPILLLDDYKAWWPVTMLLTVCDGHPLRIPIKGGHTWARFTKIIFTSNSPPSEWYDWSKFPGHYRAFKARVAERGYMVHFEKDAEADIEIPTMSHAAFKARSLPVQVIEDYFQNEEDAEVKEEVDEKESGRPAPRSVFAKRKFKRSKKGKKMPKLTRDDSWNAWIDRELELKEKNYEKVLYIFNLKK